MILACNQTKCANKNCAHRHKHRQNQYCMRKKIKYQPVCDCTRCVPRGAIVVEDEQELS